MSLLSHSVLTGKSYMFEPKGTGLITGVENDPAQKAITQQFAEVPQSLEVTAVDP